MFKKVIVNAIKAIIIAGAACFLIYHFFIDSPIILTKQGDNFLINLSSNAGYSWKIDSDPAYVQLSDKEYKSSSNMLGAPETVFYNFSALKPGKTKIAFSYFGPSQDSLPVETKVYNIIIMTK